MNAHNGWMHIFEHLQKKMGFLPDQVSSVVFWLSLDIASWKQMRDCVAPLPSVAFCPRQGRLVCYSSNRAKASFWQIVIYVWTLFKQPGLIQWGLSIPKGAFFLLSPPTMMQVGHGCQSAAAPATRKKKSLWRWRACLCMCVCLTCRPPVLSQVLPRAHSTSQSSVVAVHRMQDLQQLSRSRKECGEWISEYGGVAA